MRILLQFPEGLKQKGPELAKEYEKEGHEVFLSASACYGACDLCLDEARWLEADRIVHFGHNKFINTKLPIPVEYVPYHFSIKIEKLEKLLPEIANYKTISLGTTVQHVHQFEEMKEFFEKNGKTVLAKQGARTMGQILGCDATTIDNSADAIVFVGSGRFHPLAIDSEKPVFAYNPYEDRVRNLNEDIETLKKRRKGAIAKALTCKKFGILVSTKPGQFGIAQAKWAKQELDKRGIENAILVANELEPMSIKNFMVFDCLVNTACPRIADDQEEFEMPVLNISMLKEVLELSKSL
ncbi:diphthamide biosynthesis enzyme Dph2 [Candidatus Micrarchaeota archaeon]|nr:diphthamide biosynthesis enzyme Dph2 [Candidatus Micrarchaeota archaeon]